MSQASWPFVSVFAIASVFAVWYSGQCFECYWWAVFESFCLPLFLLLVGFLCLVVVNFDPLGCIACLDYSLAIVSLVLLARLFGTALFFGYCSVCDTLVSVKLPPFVYIFFLPWSVTTLASPWQVYFCPFSILVSIFRALDIGIISSIVFVGPLVFLVSIFLLLLVGRALL